MDTKAALGAAAGLTLTVAGGVSALFLSMDMAAPAESTTDPAPVVVEYVDQAGNPVPAPTTSTAPTPEVVLIYPDGTPVESLIETAAAEIQAEPQPEAEYEVAPEAEKYEEVLEAEHEEYEEHDEHDEEEGEYDDD